jgi:cytochrome c553
VLLAITNEGKVGLGILAGCLILFAILSSFYFPRRNPNFPGDRLGLFVLVTVVLFAGTIGGVIFFAKEEEEAHGAEPTETHASTAPSEPAGDAAAGKAVFASAGCGGCHTLEAAGSSGEIGPNLDDAKPDAQLVTERVTNGKPPMPSFADQLSEKQIQDVAAFVVESTSG